MEIEIERCDLCRARLSKINRESTWMPVHKEFKDNIHMEECIKCKTILVWRLYLMMGMYNPYLAAKLKKSIKNTDTEYLIWRLK